MPELSVTGLADERTTLKVSMVWVTELQIPDEPFDGGVYSYTT